MPSLKWIVAIAVVLGLTIAFMVKVGLWAPTGRESAVSPGKPEEGYYDHAVSTHVRTKQTIDNISQQREEQAFW